MDFGPFGFSEILFIGLLALVIFGPRRLPEIGHAAGRAAAKLKRAANELRAAYESELDDDARQQLREAHRGLTDVRDTIQAAGRDILGAGTEARRAARATIDDARAAIEPGKQVVRGGAGDVRAAHPSMEMPAERTGGATTDPSRDGVDDHDHDHAHDRDHGHDPGRHG